MIEKIIDARTIIDEVANKSVEIYDDLDINIYESIEIATIIIKAKYKGYKIVESD